MEQIMELSDGRKLDILTLGDPQGKPIIYFHGTPGSYYERGNDNDLYQQHGLHFVAINRPGTGNSSMKPDWTALTFTDDVVELLDLLSIEKASLIGFSAGGLYASALAFRYPERASHLTLLSSTGPVADQPHLYDMLHDNIRMFYDGALYDPEALLAQLSNVTTADALHALVESTVADIDKKLFATPDLRQRLLPVWSQTLRQGLSGAVKDIANIASPWGFSTKKITVPTHLWHGTADQNVPIEIGHYLAETIPDCTTTFIDQAGHYFSYQQWPDILNTHTLT